MTLTTRPNLQPQFFFRKKERKDLIIFWKHILNCPEIKKGQIFYWIVIRKFGGLKNYFLSFEFREFPFHFSEILAETYIFGRLVATLLHRMHISTVVPSQIETLRLVLLFGHCSFTPIASYIYDSSASIAIALYY